MHEWDGEPDSSSVHLHVSVSLLQGSLCSSYLEGFFFRGWLEKNLAMFKRVECGNGWELVGGGGGGGATRILGISETYRKKISGQVCKSTKMKAGWRNMPVGGDVITIFHF